MRLSFQNKGVTYTECVQTPQTANGVKNWCLVERGTAWGGCDCTGTVTAKPTPSFTESPTLELPKCLTNGRGPADKGTNCKFPFNHNGALHYKCVGTGYGGEGFCKNERGIIGGCICDTGESDTPTLAPSFTPTSAPTSVPKCITNGNGAARAGIPCVFPFNFQGSKHYACIGTSHGGQGFCIVKGGKKGGCECEITEKPTARPSVSPTTMSPTSTPTVPTEPTSMPTYAVCITNGKGDAPKGKLCKFPFMFKGSERNECVGADSGTYGPQGWCMTEDKLQGGCDCVGSTGQPTASDSIAPSESPTVARPASLAPTSMPTYHCVSNGRGQAPAGTPCAFPFKWKGQLHTKCIGSGYGGQGFCFTAAGKRAGCDCDCDTDEDGLCIDPSLGTDAPTNSPTMTGETASPTTSPTDNPTTQPGLTTESPTSSEEEAPGFRLGPVVTNTTTSRSR